MKLFSALDLRYAAARLLNMSVRPAVISAAAYFFGTASAEQVSIIIFSVAIAMLMMSIDPYRAYYKRHFNGQSSAHEFCIYIIIITTWMSVVSATMFAIMVFQHVPLLICTLAVAMFIGEKFADEILRFCLFRKDMAMWSNLVIGRSGVQLLGLTISIVFYKVDYSFSVSLVPFALGWILSFYGPVRSIVAIVRKNRVVFLGPKFYRKAGSRIVSSALLMASSLMASSPSYFDKIVTLLADRASLPLFLIASMSFSLIHNFVDFFFVSKMRLELLHNNISLGRLLLNSKLFFCIAMGLMGGAIIMAIEALFLKHIYDFDVAILALIASINILLALTAIPQQIVYWRDGAQGIFVAESGFFLPASILYLSLIGMQWTLACALGVITISLVFRFISYIVVSRQGAIVSSLLAAIGRH